VSDRQYFQYGQAGGPGQLRRFDVSGDPTPYIPIWAAGSMVVNVPAHMMGNAGGAYFYGTTKVGGITNMISNGDVLRSIITTDHTGAFGSFRNLLGGTGAGNYDAMALAANLAVLEPVNYVLADGEVFQGGGAEGAMVKEAFTMGGVTVTATNGSHNLTFSASVAALPLTFAYGYTPNKKVPLAGDLISITDGGLTHFYRLESNPTAAGVIFPAYTGTGGAGLACQIYRTGYGSYSNFIQINVPGILVPFCYYVGGVGGIHGGNPNAPLGAIEAITASSTHSMSPVASPSGNPVSATDIAFYKSFLLYGFGGAIGWSVVGFPTDTNVGFGTADFPDTNVSVINLSGDFVSFEFVGDQLVAIFTDSIWLVQATGVIPEFAFYKLSQTPGARLVQTPDPQIGSIVNGWSAFSRPSLSTGHDAYLITQRGLCDLSGTGATEIDQPVVNYDWPQTPALAALFISYDASGIITWGDQTGGRCLAMRDNNWFQIDATAFAAGTRGFVGNPGGALLTGSVANSYRPTSIFLWRPSDGRVTPYTDSLEGEATAASLLPWTWASPIVNVGRVYPAWIFGGFEIWARAATGATIPTNLSWSIYGSSDPYHMNLIQGPVTYDYATGFVNSRNRLGGTFDYPFFGIVLTGSSWIELTGVMLYPSESQAAK
jgi:hypothetical protein